MAVLEVWFGDRSSRHPFGAEPLTLGRDSTADVVIDHPRISRSHVSFYERTGRTYAEDLGSTNGTFLFSDELRPWHPRVLEDQAVVSIAGVARVVVFPADGGTLDDDRTVRDRREAPPIPRLTNAEAEVLELLFMHYRDGATLPRLATVGEIAKGRHSSPGAVKQALQQLYDKCGLTGAERNKDGLARQAIEHGLATPYH